MNDEFNPDDIARIAAARFQRSLAAGKKVSKATAHYRMSTNPKRKCEICTMFRPPHDCTAVEGEISAQGVCDYFERKKDAA